MNKLILLMCLIFIGTSHLSAQPTADSTEVPPQNFFRRSGKDLKYMGLSIWETYKRPFSWKKKEWLTFGAVVGGSALIAVTLDEPVYDFFKDRQSHAMDKFNDIGFILNKNKADHRCLSSSKRSKTDRCAKDCIGSLRYKAAGKSPARRM